MITIAHDKRLMFLFICKPESYDAISKLWNSISDSPTVDHLAETEEVRGTPDSGEYWQIRYRGDTPAFIVRGDEETVLSEMVKYINIFETPTGCNVTRNLVTQYYTLQGYQNTMHLFAKRIPLLG